MVADANVHCFHTLVAVPSLAQPKFFFRHVQALHPGTCKSNPEDLWILSRGVHDNISRYMFSENYICVICVYTIRIGIWTTKPNCPYVAFFHAPHPQPLDAGAAVAAPAPRLFSSKLRWRAAACPSSIPCTKTAPLHHPSPEKFDLINSQSYQSPAAKPLRNWYVKHIWADLFSSATSTSPVTTCKGAGKIKQKFELSESLQPSTFPFAM